MDSTWNYEESEEELSSPDPWLEEDSYASHADMKLKELEEWSGYVNDAYMDDVVELKEDVARFINEHCPQGEDDV